MADLVSVIIPTFNRAHCLARAIDSALAQSHRAVEVVVVDDGSRDNTAELVATRYGGEPRVKYLWQDNAGVVAARNTALAACNGDYVAFLDSDDWWQPWKLELQLTALDAFPRAGMVWSDMEAVDAGGAVVFARYLRVLYKAYRWFPRPEDLFTECRPLTGPGGAGPVSAYFGEIYSQMVMGNLVHTSTALLRRQRFGLVKRFDENLRLSGEDFDFHLRTCREGPVVFLDTPTIRYQIGTPDRLTLYSKAIATNFLATITKAVERDGERINLPRRMVDHVFGEAHRWCAETMVAEGDFAGARRHFLHSLFYDPSQPRIIIQTILCTMPPKINQAACSAYSRLKRLTPASRRYPPAATGRDETELDHPVTSGR